MLSANLIPFHTAHKPRTDGRRGTHGRGWKATTRRTSQGKPHKYMPIDVVAYKAAEALFAAYDLNDEQHDLLALMAGIA